MEKKPITQQIHNTVYELRNCYTVFHWLISLYRIPHMVPWLCLYVLIYIMLASSKGLIYISWPYLNTLSKAMQH